jgi:hypothetical protein
MRDCLFRRQLIHLQSTCGILDSPHFPFCGKLLIGHYFYPLLEVLKQPLYSLTFLRDPVQRAISAYQYVARSPNHPLYEQFRLARITSPSEFVRDNLFSFHGANMQTRMLGSDYDLQGLIDRITTGVISVDEAKAIIGSVESLPCDAAVLNRAIRRLEQMPFFGVTEHLSASLELLCKYLNVQTPPMVSQENAAPASDLARRIEFGQKEIDAVRDANRLDEILYRFGQRLFYERCERHLVGVLNT